MKVILAHISPSALISQLITGSFALYLLAVDNVFNLSISAIIQYAHQLDVTSHILVLGLLPIYISVVIFGAAILGAYLGRKIESHILRPANK